MKWEKVVFSALFAEKTKNGIYLSADKHGTGVKIINMGEIFAYGHIGAQEMQRVELDDRQKSQFLVEEGDLLFARRSLVEAGAGKVALINGLTEPTTFESSLIRVRLNKQIALPLFYYYWLQSHNGRTAINALVTGTNVKGIRASELQNIYVDYPSMEKQHRIANILSAYDDLIENNRKQIKLLEEAAQRLYKEWFVDLRFPGHETTNVTNGVPEGWRIEKIANVADINKYSISKDYAYDYVDYTDLSSVQNGQIVEKTRYSLSEAPGRAKRMATDGDIIWGMVRPNLKSYALVFHPKDTDIFSTGFCVLSARCVPFSYLYCAVTTDAFIGYLVNCTNGAAYPAVKPIHFAEAKLITPGEALLLRFDRMVEPLLRKKEKLHNEISNLQEGRNRLLSKLMSGKIHV